MDQFVPFMATHNYRFSCRNVRNAYARLDSEERELFSWSPETIDWREYMLEIHIPGLEKWVVPEIESKVARPARALRRHDSLLDLLDDAAEREDSVGPYGKSLLYLVSQAFESRRGVPLLGIHDHLQADERLHALLRAAQQGRKGLVIAGEPGPPGSLSRSTTHGGFDNDPDSMNSVLTRILGRPPLRAFNARDLQF
jgi:hypothetical protein